MMEETYNAPRQGGGGKTKGGFFSELKDFDLFPKVDEEFRVQTTVGAGLSVAAWVVVAILILAELQSYAAPSLQEHLAVDTSLGERLRVDLNVTFHALTCAEAHLDAMDVAGDNQLNLEHDMLKQRISESGRLLGEPAVEIVGDLEKFEPLPADYCGSCYGANVVGMPCCNSCDDIKKAYEIVGWSDSNILKNATQCLHDAKNPFAHVKKGEGCRVAGHMLVNKVSGNFHIAFGDSIVRDGMHIHQFLPQEAPTFNVSHTVHSLSFGEWYPGMPRNPLDGERHVVARGASTGLFQYYLKVVPTVYTSELGYKHVTNQYTVSERFRPFSLLPGGQLVVPGIFFIYDMSSFMVEIQNTRKPLLHVFTRLCAIVGGVFSILGIADKLIFRLDKMISGSSSK
jgi:hypothetical protein